MTGKSLWSSTCILILQKSIFMIKQAGLYVRCALKKLTEYKAKIWISMIKKERS